MEEKKLLFRRTEEVLRDLVKSRFRGRFRLGQKEIACVHSRGLETIAEHGKRFIRERLAPACPLNDGKQTPMNGHPFFIAQHAAATCCRGCLAKWHGIPKGRELSDSEREYILSATMAWLRKHLLDIDCCTVPKSLFGQ